MEEFVRQYFERKTVKLKHGEIALKQPKKATETKVVHRIVKESRSYRISFPYFKLIYTIGTFQYKVLYLTCATQLSVIHYNVQGSQELGRPALTRGIF